jgi:hypothetical protein
MPKFLIKVCVGLVFLVFTFYFFGRQKNNKVDSEMGRNVDSNPKEAIEVSRLNDKTASKVKNDRFDDWLDSLPIWLETNGFPSYFLSETRSLAVSLRAMYAERTATPNVLRGGGVESADENLSRGFSNIFSQSLSQKYLINPETPGRLYGLISSQVQSFNGQ